MAKGFCKHCTATIMRRIKYLERLDKSEPDKEREHTIEQLKYLLICAGDNLWN